MRVLVIGGASFIGPHVADALQRARARYLETFAQFGDIQPDGPRPLDDLERSPMRV